MTTDTDLRESILSARAELKTLLNQGIPSLDSPWIYETERFKFYPLPLSIKGDRHTGFGVLLKQGMQYGYWLKDTDTANLIIYLSDSQFRFARALYS